MMVIRPIAVHDLPALMNLAGKSGVGLTSLPLNEEILAARIARSVETWQGKRQRGEQGYMFVLEDSASGQVVGVSALEVSLGLNEPWYNFRVAPQVHSSASLNVYSRHETLFLSNDHTGYSELCTLYLDPDYRHNHNGKLLSKCRFLFLAAFRERFSTQILAEMRGYSDAQGHSPFWEGLGNRFFAMDFAQADYLNGTGHKVFIAELMPRHPLYVDFLPEEARNVIGTVHPDTAPARRMLESEGLRYRGYVDIFDGGPTLEADIAQLRIVKESRKVPVRLHTAPPPGDRPLVLVANDNYPHYRAILAPGYFDHDGALCLSRASVASLDLTADEHARIVTLNPQESV